MPLKPLFMEEFVYAGVKYFALRGKFFEMVTNATTKSNFAAFIGPRL